METTEQVERPAAAEESVHRECCPDRFPCESFIGLTAFEQILGVPMLPRIQKKERGMCDECLFGLHLRCESEKCTCVHRKIHAERAVAEALAGVCCR
jgi:hypothetical protein